MSDRTAIQASVKGTGHPVEQTDASGKSRCKAEEQAAVRVGEPALRSEEQPSRAKDEKHLMLKRILAAHEQWFDVRRGYEYAGRTFPGYAEFHSYGEKYVLVKSAKLWEVDTHEYLFFVLADALMECGYNAHVYGAPVADLCDRVVELAENGLNPDDRALLEPLSRLVAQRVTLADLAERESKEA